MSFTHVRQREDTDCGAACLSMISRFYGLKLPISTIRDLIKVDYTGSSFSGIMKGANSIGFTTEALKGTFEEFCEDVLNGGIKLPVIARVLSDNSCEHYVVVYKITHKYIVIGDPLEDSITKVPNSDFKAVFLNQLITFELSAQFKKANLTKGSFLKYFKYIANQKKTLLFILVTSAIVSLINISGSLIIGSIVNGTSTESTNQSRIFDALRNASPFFNTLFSSIHRVCISVILLFVLNIFIQILRSYLLSKVSKMIDLPLGKRFYDKIMNLPASFFGVRKTGDLVSRFYDTGSITNLISSATLSIFLDTLMALISGIVLITISFRLFLITLATLVIYVFFFLVFKEPIKRVNARSLKQNSDVSSHLIDSIGGIETIKSFRYEKKRNDVFNKLNEKAIHTRMMSGVLSSVQQTFISSTMAIGMLVILWIGSSLCNQGIIALSDLLIYYYLSNYFLTPVSGLLELQPQIQIAMAAADRLNDVLDAQVENNDKPSIDNVNGDIEIRNLNFRYGFRDYVLKDLNMTFKKGRKTAIIGETGCGKTTISKLLLQFYEPESGEILINHQNINDYSPLSVRGHIAYISQEIYLFSDTIYNNLRMGNDDITDERIEEVCKKCMVDSFIRSLPFGYNTKIEERGHNFSGGQKQRIAIARALLQNPDILIMDEATSNLDTVTENSIRKLIDELSSDLTVIIIAHRLNTIRNCDYIYVVDNGCVTEKGTHEELLSIKGQYYRYFSSNE